VSTERPDATALAAAVASGELHPREAVRAAIDAIEELDPTLNAVIHRRFERALDEAAEAPDGPFRGVPTVIKDLGAPSAGDPMHSGLRAARDAGYVADHDAAVVTRLRRAGFVIVGRTNTPELGSTITTEPLAYGPTRNPWDPQRSAGGSSGGSAVAVAAGMVPVAHASDGGGSIRIPASHTGLVGLKPSRGRVSRAPDQGEAWMGASTYGALARTVRDAAAVLDVLAGPEVGDPYGAPPLPAPLAAEVGADPGALRIGVLRAPPGGAPADPDTVAAVDAAAAALETLGHRVEETHPAALGEDEAVRARFVDVVAAGVAADLAAWEARLGRPIADDELERDNAALRAHGRRLGAAEYLATVEWLHAWSRRVAAWWAQGWDLLASPVLNGPAPPLGWLSHPDGAVALGRLNHLMAYTSQFNVTGQPAISLPLHWTAAGLPVGVQLVAATGREDLLVRVASQLERALPWAGRAPGTRAGV
jgi:amidase